MPLTRKTTHAKTQKQVGLLGGTYCRNELTPRCYCGQVRWLTLSVSHGGLSVPLSLIIGRQNRERKLINLIIVSIQTRVSISNAAERVE